MAVSAVPETREDTDAAGHHDDALRQLFMLSLDPDIDFDSKVSELLRIGCEALGLDVGIVSRIKDSTYTVRYVNGPDWAPEVGAQFDARRTYCADTLVANDVRHFLQDGESDTVPHPCYQDFGLASYIGVPLRTGTERVGTLNFSSPDLRAPFTEKEAELVRLFGRWLGEEWLKRDKARELVEKTMRLNAIIEAVPDAVIAVNEDREIQMTNSATERMFGHSHKALVGRNTSVLYPNSEEYLTQGEHIYRKAEKRAVGRFEMQMRRRNGTTFDSEVFIAPLRDNDNAHLGLIGVVRDISDRKALEKARAELISTVSHELRTPITSASGALKLLKAERDRLSAAMQPTLDIAERNLDRLVRLVGDILDFERLTADEVSIEREIVDVNELLTRAAEDIGPYARANDTSVRVIDGDGDGGEGQIIGDEHRLLQVLSNLMSNAIKASDPGATVEVGPTRDGRGFWVRDRGRGIPDELRSRLFERFSRAPESYGPNQGGTGLGMGVVKAIVDQHGGEIALETEQGKGTEFTLTFPKPAEAEAERPAQA